MPAAAAELRSGLCKLIPGCDTSSSDEELRINAAKLRKSWGHAVHEDKTMMKDDMKDVAECSEKMGFIQHGINKLHYKEFDGFTMSLEPVSIINTLHGHV